jgi:tetratricopeptide (TPR) repeat protein
MRRFLFLVLFLSLAVPSSAQLGKQPMMRAGSPEDQALKEVDAATEPAKKIELLNKFMTEFGKGDISLLAYERYIAAYLAAKQPAKAFEYGDKAMELDPDNFNIAYGLVIAAAERNNAERAADFGEHISKMVERYRAASAPEGSDADTWEERRKVTLMNYQDQVAYVAQVMYTLAAQAGGPGTRAALLERFVAAFPESPYLGDAQLMITDSYGQAGNVGRKVAFAEKVLARDPDNVNMLVALAEHFAAQGEQLERAEQYARKALRLIPQAEKPAHLSDGQWAARKNLQTGLCRSALGQAYVHLVRDADAVEPLRGAGPLLRPYAFYYGRNQYFLGFVLARMKRTAEAREVLTEAVTIDSPYRERAQDTLNRIGGPVRRPAKKSQ